MLEKGLVWAIALGAFNIAMNTFASKAAEGAGWWEAMSRPTFAVAFITGTCSLGLMMGLYTSGYPLGRGILVAGATSIVLGVLWATFLHGNRLTPIEWLLWGAIVVFYGARALGAFGSRAV